MEEPDYDWVQATANHSYRSFSSGMIVDNTRAFGNMG